MKSKVILYLLLVLAALLAGVLLMNRKGVFGRSNTAFAVPAGSDITMVELSQGGTKILLRKGREGWSVNGIGEVRGSAVSFLLQTLNEIAIKSPVSDDLFEMEVIAAGVEPVRVRAWSGKKSVASFLVYKTGSNVYGNIMKKSERSKPFIMSIPGYEGSIGSNFNMNELFWLPFTVFNLFPSEIASVEVIYSGRPEESFRINNPARLSGRMGGGELPGGGSQVPVGGGQLPDSAAALPGGGSTTQDAGFLIPSNVVDSVKVMRYLSYYTMVPFETWAFDLSRAETDSVLALPESVVISVTRTDGEVEKLRIWERHVTGSEGLPVSDTDRAWGAKDESNEIFVVRFFDIDPLLRKRSYFFGPNNLFDGNRFF